MAIYCHICPYMAKYGLIRPYMTIYVHIWPYMVIYGHVWPCMAIHGPYMAIYGHTWPYMGGRGHLSMLKNRPTSKYDKLALHKNTGNMYISMAMYMAIYRPHIGHT